MKIMTRDRKITVQRKIKQKKKRKRSKKKKENLKTDAGEQQQQLQTNDHSSNSELEQMKIPNSTEPSSSGSINRETLGKVIAKISPESTTSRTSDRQDSPLNDSQAIQKLELQRQIEEMESRIKMLRAEVAIQHTPTEIPIETNESSLQESNDHLPNTEPQPNSIQGHERQVEGMPTAQTGNQPGPSNNNMESHQIVDGSPNAENEGDFTLNGQSFNGIPNKQYNILLLGQTGVGKSTFINAFANYLTYNSLEEANKAKLVSLIPCQFSLSDDSFTQRNIQFGQDENENMGQDQAQSSTQRCRAYQFPVQDFVLRIIDSPGIGDTRGIIQDCMNLGEIFTFITQYAELHAICILLKPNESKLNTTFQFCITQFLCQLHKNASKNIVFIFTNSRNTFYRPGDTAAPLKVVLDRIRGTPPYVDIPFRKENIFCLDSEAFRFLVAAKHEVIFSESDRENIGKSWTKSAEECSRLIRYVVEGPDGQGLAPHNIQDTTSINEARRAIVDLLRPLAENARLLQDNIHILNLKLKEIEEFKDDANKLKDILYIPTLSLQVNNLDQPRTVCMSDKCRQVSKVGHLNRYNYPAISRSPRYSKNVLGNVGPEQFRHCNEMDRDTAMCEQCGCHYSEHIHIYYESQVIEKKEVDRNTKSKLKTKTDTIKFMKITVNSLKGKVKEYEDVQALLTKLTAKLTVFLQQNALVGRVDAIEEHLKQEIENETSLNAVGANNADLIQRLNTYLQKYTNEKKQLEEAACGPAPKETITTKEVMESITQLQQMKICGETFTKIMQAQVATKTNKIAQGDIPVPRGRIASAFHGVFRRLNDCTHCIQNDWFRLVRIFGGLPGRVGYIRHLMKRSSMTVISTILVASLMFWFYWSVNKPKLMN